MANGQSGGGFWKGYLLGFITLPVIGIVASIVVGTVGLIIGTRGAPGITPGAGSGNNGNDTGSRPAFDVSPRQ